MAKTELDTAFANVSALLSLAQWHMLENAKRTRNDLSAPYEIAQPECEQIMALLIVTDDYAKRVLAEHDEARRQSEGGAS